MARKLAGRALPRWTQRGCRDADPDIFFAIEKWDEKPHPFQSQYCRGCIIQQECLQWALDNDEKWGVWGDTTPFQRQQILRGIHRVRCLGCGSFDILTLVSGAELCVSCGLSWKL